MCPILSTQQKSLTHFCVVLMCQRAARWEKVKWIPLRLFWQPTQCRHDTQSVRMIVFVSHIFTLADEKSHWCDILLGSLPNKHVILHLENQFLKKTAASLDFFDFCWYFDELCSSVRNVLCFISALFLPQVRGCCTCEGCNRKPCECLSEQRIHSVVRHQAHSAAAPISSLWLGDNRPIWFRGHWAPR